MEQILDDAGLKLNDIDYIVATGYGRVNVPFADKQITEIKCHMKGVTSLFPEARTIIDVGGQDAKGIKTKNGRIENFIMNNRCAAGTGRFLEIMADVLGVDIKEIGPESLKSDEHIKISSTCSIFAQQEVIRYLSEGINFRNILNGLHDSVAYRISNMVRTLGIEREIVLTGGGAKNVGLIRAFEDRLGEPMLIPDEPLITGALGAAVLAREELIKGNVADKNNRKLIESKFFTTDSNYE